MAARDRGRKDSGVKQVPEEAKEERKLRQVINTVLKTAAGRDLFRHLHEICGFAKSSITVMSSGEVATEATVYNEARRGIYLNVRNRAAPELLIPIELPEPEETEEKKLIKKEKRK